MPKRIILSIIIFVTGLIGVVQQTVMAQSTLGACVDDALEDNDTIAQASPVELGTYSPLAICEGDSDYFVIDLPGGYLAEVELSFTDDIGDIDVYILNTAQVTIAQSISTSDNELATFRTTSSGLYYIRVIGYQGAEANYSMSIDQKCPGCMTYQGRLEDGTTDANGDYEFVFTLFDSLTDGVQLGTTATRTITVDEGLFASALHFGDRIAYGNIYPQFLNIAVRSAGSNDSFTTLSPRTELTAAPAALSLVPHSTISGTRNLSPTINLYSRDSDGIRMSSVEFDGVQIDKSGDNGIEVNEAGGHGVYAISVGSNDYGGYFVSDAISTTMGYGVYARASENEAADITLGGNGTSSSQDDGRIRSDPNYDGSDIYLNPQDHVFVRLDTNGSNSSSFDIQNGTGIQVWSVDESGNVSNKGSSVTTVESASRGELVAMYSMSATENWFEDFGRSTLAKSRAIVQIDPIFAEIAELSAETYHVFLTPHGACSLYVAETNATSFTVQSIEPDCAINFDYRVVGKRVGYEKMRMEPAQDVDTEAQETVYDNVEVSDVEIDTNNSADEQPTIEEDK